MVSTHYFSPPLASGFVVRVNIVDDTLTEGEEMFSVELSAFDISVVLVNSVAEVVIEDDDTSRKIFLLTETNTVIYLTPTVSCPRLPNPPNGSVYSTIVLMLELLLSTRVTVASQWWDLPTECVELTIAGVERSLSA